MQDAVGASFVRDEMISPAPNERQIPRPQFDRVLAAVDPKLCLPARDGVDGELNNTWEPKPPRRDCNRPCKHTAGSPGAQQVLL